MEGNKGLFFFQYFKNPSTKWSYKLDLDKKTIVSINRIRSGHCSLKNSLFKYNMIDNDICSCGQELKDLKHVFWHCNKYNKEHKNMVKEFNKKRIKTPFDIQVIFKNSKLDLLEIVIDFRRIQYILLLCPCLNAEAHD